MGERWATWPCWTWQAQPEPDNHCRALGRAGWRAKEVLLWRHCAHFMPPVPPHPDEPQSWMALLRREIGHFHEKRELPLDTRWAGV